MGKIVKNAAKWWFSLPILKKGQKYLIQKGIKCNTCKTELYSNYRHDFRACSCSEKTMVFIDGGTGCMDYQRFGKGEKGSFINIKRKITLRQLKKEIKNSI